MSDTDGKKPLGLGGAPRSGQVKQSFSHGRTKRVVVETKRKRVMVPTPVKPGAPSAGTPSASTGLGDPSKRPAGSTDAEMERRLTALRAAKAREVEDAARRAEEEKAREEDRARRREEIEAKEREDRERAEALRLKAEEEERAAKAEAAAKIAAAEARKADVLGTRARSTTPPPAAAKPADRAAPAAPAAEDARGPASAKPGLPTPRKTDRDKDDRADRGAKRGAGDEGRRSAS